VDCFGKTVTGSSWVLVNDKEQHSLWPSPHDVPAGWRVVQGPDTRDNCMASIEESWIDMRAESLIESTSRRAD
jgi:MbtH protein